MIVAVVVVVVVAATIISTAMDFSVLIFNDGFSAFSGSIGAHDGNRLLFN